MATESSEQQDRHQTLDVLKLRVTDQTGTRLTWRNGEYDDPNGRAAIDSFKAAETFPIVGRSSFAL